MPEINISTIGLNANKNQSDTGLNVETIVINRSLRKITHKRQKLIEE